MTSSSFKVNIPMIPMSGSQGKRRYERKKEIADAVRNAKGEELEAARIALKDKRVKVSVRFNLPKPSELQSDSLGKKDLDNMLKLVLDALQTKVDAQGKRDGLGLINFRSLHDVKDDYYQALFRMTYKYEDRELKVPSPRRASPSSVRTKLIEVAPLKEHPFRTGVYIRAGK